MVSTSLACQEYIDYIIGHEDAYYRMAYSFMGNEADAMDAISQMTMIVLEKHSTLRNPSVFSAWSKKILANVCRTKLKERKKVIPIEEDNRTADTTYSDLDQEFAVKAYVDKLPTIYREIIILRFYLRYEYKEIAQLLNIPIGTVKSRINRGVAILQDKMGGEYYE